MEKKVKCFADYGFKCLALINKKCDGCSFYKTQEEKEKGDEMVKERLKKKGLIK